MVNTKVYPSSVYLLMTRFITLNDREEENISKLHNNERIYFYVNLRRTPLGWCRLINLYSLPVRRMQF